MERRAYLNLMQFPHEWEEWRMLPEHFLAEQAAEYEIGQESASEHDRHGVFQWWLRRELTEEELVRLARLAWLDPDSFMAASVLSELRSLADGSPAAEAAVQEPYRRA